MTDFSFLTGLYLCVQYMETNHNGCTHLIYTPTIYKCKKNIWGISSFISILNDAFMHLVNILLA